MNDFGLISPAAAARLLGISPHTLAVWRSAKRYKLPYIKIGSRVRYRKTDIERFVQTRQRTS
jgi:predicted site-specific integrase-resolvase